MDTMRAAVSLSSSDGYRQYATLWSIAARSGLAIAGVFTDDDLDESPVPRAAGRRSRPDWRADCLSRSLLDVIGATGCGLCSHEPGAQPPDVGPNAQSLPECRARPRVGCPHINGDTEQAIRSALAAGKGIRKVAREVGTGVSVVQRIKAERMNGELPRPAKIAHSHCGLGWTPGNRQFIWRPGAWIRDGGARTLETVQGRGRWRRGSSSSGMRFRYRPGGGIEIAGMAPGRPGSQTATRWVPYHLPLAISYNSAGGPNLIFDLENGMAANGNHGGRRPGAGRRLKSETIRTRAVARQLGKREMTPLHILVDDDGGVVGAGAANRRAAAQARADKGGRRRR